MNRRPTIEALHRVEPQKSVCRLSESMNITWGTVLADLFGVQAARIHRYLHDRSNLDTVLMADIATIE